MTRANSEVTKMFWYHTLSEYFEENKTTYVKSLNWVFNSDSNTVIPVSC